MQKVLSITRIVVALLATPALAMAAQGDDLGPPRLGLSPGEPQVRSATPALPFGVQPIASKEYVLDFHGYFLLPARLRHAPAREPDGRTEPARSSTRRR